MAERKGITKSTRFEVFKRDKFKCQYCGRTAPDVILEVDHILPVAEGGGNDLFNLITSCRDCNRGKGKKKLDDESSIKKQTEELALMAVRKEQMEMMLEWKKELISFKDETASIVINYVNKNYSYGEGGLNEYGEADIKRLLHQFTVEEVIEAIDIAFSQYYNGTDYSWNKAVNRIGGICYNRRKDKIEAEHIKEDDVDESVNILSSLPDNTFICIFKPDTFEKFKCFFSDLYEKDFKKEYLISEDTLRKFLKNIDSR